jgi:hypothetical protein
MSPSSLTSILPSNPRPERQGSRLLTPTTNAIPLVSSKYGKNYAILHTVAVVTLFVLQIGALVADPYRVMILDLGPLILLQCAFCASCLPPTGTWSNTTSNDGNDIAGGVSGKTTKGMGTGSLRKRAAGLGRAGAPGPGGWKGKVTVCTTNTAIDGQNILMIIPHPADTHFACFDSVAASNTTDDPCARPRRPFVSSSSRPPHRCAMLAHLPPRHPATLLHTRSLWARVARRHCCMATVRRSGRMGRKCWQPRRRLARSYPHGARLGPRLAGLARHGVGGLLCRMGSGKDIARASVLERKEDRYECGVRTGSY